MRPYERVVVVLACLTVAACAASRTTAASSIQSAGKVFDVIVRGGTILDGTGLTRYRADVGIIGDQIATVGDLSRDSGRTTIIANGLFVAPGFINIHSHATRTGVATAENVLTQGVTTEIINADGVGAWTQRADSSWVLDDIAEELAKYAQNGMAVNVGAYVGFDNVFYSAVTVNGRGGSRATDAQIARMQADLRRNLEQGAWGVSAGLDYGGSNYVETDQVIKIVAAAAKWRTNFPNHERLTAETGFSSRVGIAETITIGERAGLVPVITHMKAQGREQGTATQLLAMMDDATRRGHYVAADAYPYTRGMSAIQSLTIPRWMFEGSDTDLKRRLQDPPTRARAATEADATIAARWGGPDAIHAIPSGKSLPDIMREFGVTSAGEAILTMMDRNATTMAAAEFGSDADVAAFLAHPNVAVSCDCGARRPGPGHPRDYGTFPKVLGRYVRERHVLTWENAVRKMTGLPANIIGLVDRGFLSPGMAADIVVFDSATIVDRATYESAALLSEGIRHVLVGGKPALADGKSTGTKAGHVLLRSPHMPSRPMSIGATRRVNGSGVVSLDGSGASAAGVTTITLDVTQNPTQRSSTGTLRIASPDRRFDATMTEFGLLQTSNGWASLSGRVRLSSNQSERSVVMLIESADPLVSGSPATITIAIEGIGTLTGVQESGRVSVSQRP